MEDASRNDGSLGATAICASSGEPDHNPVNTARRSMSIFNRRGATTPEPTSSVPLAAVATSGAMSQKQRTWLLRESSGAGSMASKSGRFKSPRGTVLHAFPPASYTRLSALEEEMAHSANEEILSAISERPSAVPRPVSKSIDPSTKGYEIQDRLTPTRENNCGDASSRIDVWVEGVVHWNEGPFPEGGTTHLQPITPGPHAIKRKPCLSVTIPNSEIGSSPRMIYQPRPHRPLSSTMQTSCSVAPPIERPSAPYRRHSPVSGPSRSSTSSSYVGEDASICSNRSSATSNEATASVRDKGSRASNNTGQPAAKFDREYDPYSYLSASGNAERQRWVQPSPLPSLPFTSMPNDRQMRKTNARAPTIRLVSPQNEPNPASPTWSQAERDLQLELSTDYEHHNHDQHFSLRTALSGPSIRRSGSVREVMQPPSRAPTIPKRSRKREWRAQVAFSASELQRRQSEMPVKASGPSQASSSMERSISVSCVANYINTIAMAEQGTQSPPERSTRRHIPDAATFSGGRQARDDLVSRQREAIAAAMMPTGSTEDVLLHILSRLHTPKDLLNTAIINKGMYRVFQENELHLLRTAVFNESAALWELLEWSSRNEEEVGSSSCDHAHTNRLPSTYMNSYRRENAVIKGLQKLIVENCQSFLRRETVIALSTPTHPAAQRVDDAFWRIWTFCRIFGSEKNREDDITGQMDWLRGGVLANNEDCIASTDPNMDFDLRSVLISPPACFAESNRGGLDAGQLFDMTEVWTCMTALLQRYHGRVGQARYYGVFDRCEAEEGDVKIEAAILEEWTAYLLTLGPSVVLKMAQLYPAAGFALARENGWSRWTPPILNGSRSSFLKEPVAKSSEEQIIVAKQRQRDPAKQVRKDASRRRVATLAAEIRVRRQSSAYKRSPLIDMTTERAMSMMSRRDSVSPTRVHHSREPSQRISSAPMRMSMDPQKSRAIVAESVGALRYENSVGMAQNTFERAVQQLLTMGFERSMAVDALRITDRGDGIRPDRAVDLLLRQQE